MKKLLALLLAMLMVVGLFAGCVSEPAETTPSDDTTPSGSTGDNETEPSVDPEAAKYGGNFTLGYGSIGDTLDPMKTSGWKSYCWSMNVYEGVLARDASGKLAPGVCDFEVSEDNLKLTLWVREGVKFHDGTDVEIEDVLASIQRASGTVSRMKKHYVPYLKSETIEGDKLIIEFTEYSIDTLWYFAANQTWNVVLPKEICEKYGTDNAIVDVADAIGTGPYKVVSFQAGAEVKLTRFEDYVPVAEGRTGVAAPKKAYFDNFTIVVLGESQVDYMKMVEGKIDFMGQDENLSELYLGAGLTLDQSLETAMYYLNFNCDGKGAVKDANIRKAIAAAIDYETLGTVGGELMMTEKENWSPVAGSYSADKYSAADYHGAANVELAKSYLTKAGYNGEEIVLVMQTGQGDIEPYIRADLEAAGINLKVEWMDATAMSEFILNPDNNWSMTFASSSVVEVPSTIATKFISDSWTHERKDEIMTELGQHAVGSDKSIALWNELDQILADECPSVIIGQRTAGTWVHNSDLVWEQEGFWVHWWNAYWKNPEDHK